MSTRKQPSYRKFMDQTERKAKKAEQLHRRNLRETAYLNTFTNEDSEDDFEVNYNESGLDAHQTQG
jgi:hypothetical protein